MLSAMRCEDHAEIVDVRQLEDVMRIVVRGDIGFPFVDLTLQDFNRLQRGDFGGTGEERRRRLESDDRILA